MPASGRARTMLTISWIPDGGTACPGSRAPRCAHSSRRHDPTAAPGPGRIAGDERAFVSVKQPGSLGGSLTDVAGRRSSVPNHGPSARNRRRALLGEGGQALGEVGGGHERAAADWANAVAASTGSSSTWRMNHLPSSSVGPERGELAGVARATARWSSAATTRWTRPRRQGLGGVEAVAGERHLAGGARPDGRDQRRVDDDREQPDRDLRGAEGGALGGDRDVGGSDDAAAAGEGVPVRARRRRACACAGSTASGRPTRRRRGGSRRP